MDDYIKEIGNSLDFTSNLINEFENGILLTNSEIAVLNKYKINYKNCTSLKNLISKIEIVLEENEYEDIDDLDYVSQTISERDYYQNTNK